MLSEHKKIKLNFWLLIAGLLLPPRLFGLLVLVTAAGLTIHLWKTQNLNLSLSHKELISIAIYSIFFPVALASDIEPLITAGLFVTAPFLSMGYLLGGFVAGIITPKIAYPGGLIIAIYLQAHWLYVLYRAKRNTRNA